MLLDKFAQLRNFDWLLGLAAVFLTLFGLVALYSAPLNVDSPEVSRFLRQVVFFMFGLALAGSLAFLDYRSLRPYSFWLYFLTVLLLIGVLIFGTEIRGTKGWIFLGSFGFQPVEFAKVAFVIFLAMLLSKDYS